jgi:hypothetical protein
MQAAEKVKDAEWELMDAEWEFQDDKASWKKKKREKFRS